MPGPLPVPFWSQTWIDLMTQWTQYMAAAALSPYTIKKRIDDMKRFSRFAKCEPAEVTEALAAGYLSNPRWSPESKRGYRSALQQFYSWAVRRDLVPHDPAAELPKVRIPRPRARAIPDPMLRDALRLADPRSALILMIAAQTGARRAEIAQIHRFDMLKLDDGWYIVLHGKGGKDRQNPISDRLAHDILQGCSDRGWLFPSTASPSGHLTAVHIGNLASWALPEGWTLHTLRHRFATVIAEASGNLAALQQLLGHESLAATQRYIGVSNAAKRRVAVLAELDPR